MITRNSTMTALLKWPNYNELAKCSHRVHKKPGLAEISAKLKKTFICWKSANCSGSKAKSLRNLASHFGISVGAVNNILKRKREYENLGDPLG